MRRLWRGLRVSSPTWVVGVYVVVATGWIVGSSWAARALVGVGGVGGVEQLFQMESAKGIVFVAVTGVLLWLLLVRMTREITERSRAAERNERRYRELFEAAPVATFVYDVGTRRVVEASRWACRTYGYLPGEMVGLPLSELTDDPGGPRGGEGADGGKGGTAAGAMRADLRADSPPDTPPDTPAGQMVEETEEGTLTLLRHRRKGGERFAAQVLTRPIDRDGSPAMLMVVQDLSDLLGVRRALRSANARIEERVTERTALLHRSMTELEWFSEALTQDLRSPLVHMQGLARQLLETSVQKLDQRELETLHRLVGSSARVANLLDELLEFARLGGTTGQTRWDDDSPAGGEVNGRVNGEAHERRDGEVVSIGLLVAELIGQLSRESPDDNYRVLVREPLYWTRAPRPLLSRVVMGLLRVGVMGGDEAPMRVYAELDGPRAGEEGSGPMGWVNVYFECDEECLDEGMRLALIQQMRAERSAPPSVLLRDRESLPRGTSLALIVRSVWGMGGRLGFEPARVRVTSGGAGVNGEGVNGEGGGEGGGREGGGRRVGRFVLRLRAAQPG